MTDEDSQSGFATIIIIILATLFAFVLGLIIFM